MSKPYRPLQVEEQVVLEELQVQLVGQEDLPRFQSLLRRHHYLGAIRPVGERGAFTAPDDVTGLALEREVPTLTCLLYTSPSPRD